jgi:hypothetical protein
MGCDANVHAFANLQQQFGNIKYLKFACNS